MINNPSEAIIASCDTSIAYLTEHGIGDAEWYTLPREVQYDKWHAIIGNTPLEKIQLAGAEVYAKSEFNNPSGSHYDRAYLATLRTLELRGLISPGDELRDITSGSAGSSLALIGSLLNYKVNITVPPELPANRTYPMHRYGAKVTVSGDGYIKQASQEQSRSIHTLLRSGWRRVKTYDAQMNAIILEKDDNRICYINHSENQASPDAFTQIGQEIVDQSPRPLDHLVLAIGNWTTIAGISPVIRSAWPNTHITGFEDARNAPTFHALHGQTLGDFSQHDSYGTSSIGVPLKFNQHDLIDDAVTVKVDERSAMDELFNTSRPLLAQIGHSSLMGLVVAERLLKEDPRAQVGLLFYDQKVRY